MNIFKKFYQKYIVGISYPIDKNATATEKLYHIGVDESHPCFRIAKYALEHKPEITYLFNLKMCDYEALNKAYETKERFFDHYIITKLVKTKDNDKLLVTLSRID